MRKHFIISSLIIFFLSAGVAFANAGFQRVVDGKYVVQLSISPLAPFEDEKAQMVFSFSDIQGKSLTQSFTAKFKFLALGDEKVLFETDEDTIEKGLFPLEYTFADPGFYRAEASFYFPDVKDKIYTAEFPLEVKEVRTQKVFGSKGWLVLIGGIFVGWILSRTMRFIRGGSSRSGRFPLQ